MARSEAAWYLVKVDSDQYDGSSGPIVVGGRLLRRYTMLEDGGLAEESVTKTLVGILDAVDLLRYGIGGGGADVKHLSGRKSCPECGGLSYKWAEPIQVLNVYRC